MNDGGCRMQDEQDAASSFILPPPSFARPPPLPSPGVPGEGEEAPDSHMRFPCRSSCPARLSWQPSGAHGKLAAPIYREGRMLRFGTNRGAVIMLAAALCSGALCAGGARAAVMPYTQLDQSRGIEVSVSATSGLNRTPVTD